MKPTTILLLVFLLIFISDCYPMQVVQGKTNPGIRLQVTNNGLQYGKHPVSEKRKRLEALYSSATPNCNAITHRTFTSFEIPLT